MFQGQLISYVHDRKKVCLTCPFEYVLFKLYTEDRNRANLQYVVYNLCILLTHNSKVHVITARYSQKPTELINIHGVKMAYEIVKFVDR